MLFRQPCNPAYPEDADGAWAAAVYAAAAGRAADEPAADEDAAT